MEWSRPHASHVHSEQLPFWGPAQCQADHSLRELVEPLLDTPAFNRLDSISFLGILSPKFAARTNSPLLRRRTLNATTGDDGSRRDHSVGVANISLAICRHLALSKTLQRYAVAWGLLHDLGNWPLSHTGQHAFAKIVGASTKSVRNWIITDDSRAPSKYWMSKALVDASIDPERLLNLFEKTPDEELEPIHTLFRCSLTPDMLEGVWRSGQALEVRCPGPSNFEDAFAQNLMGGISLQPTHDQIAREFWRTKATIYRRFFSAKTIVLWESAWSAAILDLFADEPLTLEQSLDLCENELVTRVSEKGLPVVEELHRWKPPVQQRLKRRAPREIDLDCLGGTFIEEPSKIAGPDGSKLTRQTTRS